MSASNSCSTVSFNTKSLLFIHWRISLAEEKKKMEYAEVANNVLDAALQDNFLTYVASREQTNVVCVYTWVNSVISLNQWTTSPVGAEIWNYLFQDRFSNGYLRGLFIDTEKVLDDQLDLTLIHNIIDSVEQWTWDLHEPENIKVFTTCIYCQSISTLKFCHNTLPNIKRDFLMCCNLCYPNYF